MMRHTHFFVFVPVATLREFFVGLASGLPLDAFRLAHGAPLISPLTPSSLFSQTASSVAPSRPKCALLVFAALIGQ